MARIFITGSADGLGHLAAKSLLAQGHQVVLHARTSERAREALLKLPAAENILVANLSDMDETIKLAGDVNALGTFDAVIHNAGVYDAELRELLHVNTLAPYILTCLIEKPKRLIYLSSGMHLQGNPRPDEIYPDRIRYSDTKLHVLLLSMATARLWLDVYSNAVNPGWVPTKMGGKGAPDDLNKGADTQVWLAVSNNDTAKVSGGYFYHKTQQPCHAAASDAGIQDELLQFCAQLSGVHLPR